MLLETRKFNYDMFWKLVLSVSSYCVVFFISLFAEEQIFFLQGWKGYFVPLLIISGILSIIIVVFKLHIRVAVAFVAVKLIFILVIGYPLGRYIDIEHTLLLIFILESELYLPKYWGIGAALIGITVVLVSQHDVFAWGLHISGATRHDILVMIVQSMLFFVLVTITRYALANARNNREVAEHYDSMVQEIAKANLGFQDHAEVIQFEARESERKRITRELHDSMGYTLTSHKMMLEAAILLEAKKSEKLAPLLKKAKVQIQEGHADVRKALRQLRIVEDQNVTYLHRLKHITDNFQQATGVAIQLDTSNLPLYMPAEIALILHRLVQEGMTNAFGHGKADEIIISMYINESILKVLIIDNGKGADNIEEGIGLRGMNERISPMGGKLSCHNLSPGFKLVAEIPMKGESFDSHFAGR